MNQLLRAQAYLCNSPVSQIEVNTEGRAADGGCDGWSAAPATPDQWLGSEDTCWQFKAGNAGEPRNIKTEVIKPIPAKTLRSKGRFVVVASGSNSGKAGRNRRLKALKDAAKAANIPSDNIDVIDSERLTTWCNQHPAIAARWAGLSSGLCEFEEWARSEEHQIPWQQTEARGEELVELRRSLDLQTGDIRHLHIMGPPGVGKSRFALELCRNSPWQNAVIYERQGSNPRLFEILDTIAQKDNAHARLVVVADEVPDEQLRPLRDAVGRSDGRLRLITVGHGHSPEPNSRIPEFVIKSLDHKVMRNIVEGWGQANQVRLPREHVDFIVKFADGYVRLARLAIEAVFHDPGLDVYGLLSRHEIKHFLDAIFKDKIDIPDRRALYVLAVCMYVGWSEDREDEGKVIAKHFDLNWDDVRIRIEQVHKKIGIAPRGGRYRYISPTPLGSYLAVEAWETFPDKIRTLPDVLPREAAIDAYDERLRSIASTPQAQEFAKDELRLFFSVKDFVDARSVRRWSMLAAADPALAAQYINRALIDTSIEERQQIAEQARREAVWALVKLAQGREAFHDAAQALALLAEAENESWGNNATAEFIARFTVIRSHTAVPYLERLELLDKLLTEQRSSMTQLVVKALAQVGNRTPGGAIVEPISDHLPEAEWRPTSGLEGAACVRAGLERLTRIARQGLPELENELVSIARELNWLLREAPVRSEVITVFEAIRNAYPDSQEFLRRAIADVIYREKNYHKRLKDDDLNQLEDLHSSFEDTTLDARLQQHIGNINWDRDEQPDFTPLAEELFTTPNALHKNWNWLTSGAAEGAWQLGLALARVDPNGQLAEILPKLPGCGHDLRILAGYVHGQRKIQGDNWYDRWLTSQLDETPASVALFCEVAWRCGFTEGVAQALTEVLRNRVVSPQIIGQLGFGRPGEGLPAEVLEPVLQAMEDTGHRVTALRMLAHRLKIDSSEFHVWKPLALKLALNPELIRSKHMTNHYWKEIAKLLVSEQAKEIASAIIHEQGNSSADIWFIKHSTAAEVLRACAEHDPISVWIVISGYLKPHAESYRLSMGFPSNVLDVIPVDLINQWIRENPEERSIAIAGLMGDLSIDDLSNDEKLAAVLIENFGEIDQVEGTLFSSFISGSWCGPASVRWDNLADEINEVYKNTSLSRLRRWTKKAYRSLRDMAKRDRKREEEEKLRRH